MIYGWIIGGLAALDLGVKSVVEGQEDETFPRELIHEGKAGIGKGDSAYGDFRYGRGSGGHDAG